MYYHFSFFLQSTKEVSQAATTERARDVSPISWAFGGAVRQPHPFQDAPYGQRQLQGQQREEQRAAGRQEGPSPPPALCHAGAGEEALRQEEQQQQLRLLIGQHGRRWQQGDFISQKEPTLIMAAVGSTYY